MLAGLVGAGIGSGATLLLAEQGPQGPRGERGPPGQPGESAVEALEQAEEALDRVGSVEGHVSDAQDQITDLDSGLASVEDVLGADRFINEIDDLRSRLDLLAGDVVRICRELFYVCPRR